MPIGEMDYYLQLFATEHNVFHIITEMDLNLLCHFNISHILFVKYVNLNDFIQYNALHVNQIECVPNSY